MDEQRSQVWVASLGDAAEGLRIPARLLTRRQPEEARQVASRWEALNVAERRNQRRRREEADAGDRPQPLDVRAALCDPLELLLDFLDALA